MNLRRNISNLRIYQTTRHTKSFLLRKSTILTDVQQSPPQIIYNNQHNNQSTQQQYQLKQQSTVQSQTRELNEPYFPVTI